MGFSYGVALALQLVVVSVSAQSSGVYTSANNNYFDGNRDNYATFGSSGSNNKGRFVGNLNNNVFSNDENRAFTDGFNKNAQGRDNSFISNSGVKNNAYSGGAGDGQYFSSSASNNKNNKGGFSNDNAFTTSTSSTDGSGGAVSKSYSGNINDIKDAFGDTGLYQDGQKGIQAAVNSFGSGSLGGIVGPQAFDYSRQARPSADAYAPLSSGVTGNGLQVGYVDSFLNPQVPSQGRGFGGYNQFNEGRVFRPVQVRESNRASGSGKVDRSHAPVITNSYTPPTTYSGLEDSKVDSFFQVTNPLSNKQAVISGYRPSNNFVDPSHFVIPKEDKYEMVNQLFSGGLSQFGKSQNPDLLDQPLRSTNIPRYSNVDDGLKNLGTNYYTGNNRKSDFGLGFFNDDKDGYKTGKQFASSASNPKASVQSYTDSGGKKDSYKSGQGYQDHKGFSDQGRQNFDNSYDLRSSTGNVKASNHNQGQDAQYSSVYQPNQGISPQQSTAYAPNKNINLLKNPNQTPIIQQAAPPLNTLKQPSFAQGPTPYQQPRPNLFNSRQQSPFNPAPQASFGGGQYQGNSLFGKRQELTPLFTGFSPNKRITVDEFKNKNLLGDQSFGQTEYDRKRPTSTSVLGSDLYRQANFGGQNSLGVAPNQLQPYNQALQTNTLPNAQPAFNKQVNTFTGSPNQNLAFGKGGNGYNLVSGKTQSTGSSYDDGQSFNRGYTNSFDDNKSKSTGGQDKGGFAAYSEKVPITNGKS